MASRGFQGDKPLTDPKKRPDFDYKEKRRFILPLATAIVKSYPEADATKLAAIEISKVIWKAVPSIAMTDPPRTVTLNWTDLDLTAHTSENAKLAILLIRFRASVIGSTPYSELEIREKGSTTVSTARLRVDAAGITAVTDQYTEVVVGLDSGQVVEYRIDVGTGWTVDSRIAVLGYIE
ncbi:hypothetical protein ES708_04726 [subsurface metagenome]